MIDLHCHTLYSDGADSVETLLRRAAEKELSWLSITDHNSVGAYRDPAMADQKALYPGKLLRGVEITCMFEGEIVEVLGYGFDLEQMERELSNTVLPFREKQLRERGLIQDAFLRAGVRFDPDAIVFDPDHESSRKAFLAQFNLDPANRRLLSDPDSWQKSSAFTRREIYNPQSPLYVDESSLYPTVARAARAVHDCGGIALLAHLYIYAHAQSFRARLADIVTEAELDGVECAHSAFTQEQITDLEDFCAKWKLLSSGGSDYHGARKPGIDLGTGKGALRVPEDYLSQWPKHILSRAL